MQNGPFRTNTPVQFCSVPELPRKNSPISVAYCGKYYSKEIRRGAREFCEVMILSVVLTTVSSRVLCKFGHCAIYTFTDGESRRLWRWITVLFRSEAMVTRHKASMAWPNSTWSPVTADAWLGDRYYQNTRFSADFVARKSR